MHCLIAFLALSAPPQDMFRAAHGGPAQDMFVARTPDCLCRPGYSCGCDRGRACDCGPLVEPVRPHKARACVCSPACTCGCQEGGPCTCESRTLAPVSLPPAPTVYPAAPSFLAPVHAANHGFSFAPAFRPAPALALPFVGGGLRCGPGG